jgi:hypothetical protein
VSRPAAVVSFAPTPGEIWRARAFIDSRSLARLVILYVLIPVVAAVVVTLAAGEGPVFGLVLVAVYVAIAVALTAAVYLVRYRANSEYRQWRTLTFHADGVTVAVRQTADMDWQSFKKAYFRSDGLILMTGRNRSFLWIPYRAFGSPQDLGYAKDLVGTNLG